MKHNNFIETQAINYKVDYTSLAIWVHNLNDVIKTILEDMEDGPDEDDFCRLSFDQSLEQDLNGLLMHCPVDPFELDVVAKSINPYLTAFVHSLEEEVVDQDVDHFQQVSPSLLLETIRKNLDSDHLQKGLENLTRNERQTSTSLLRYILSLKAAFSKLMIVRLDLYTQDWAGAIRDWEMLRKFIAHRFMGSHVGYAIKFEYGVKRGVHMHTVLFFDGSRVRQDVTIAKAIGEHWKASVTGGTYSNCNSPEHVKRMHYPAVGTFHELDERTLKGLEHIANYLTKQDLAVRFAVPGLSHLLRRGCITKEMSFRIARRARRHARKQVFAFHSEVTH